MYVFVKSSTDSIYGFVKDHKRRVNWDPRTIIDRSQALMLRCGDYLVEWVVKNTRTIEASIVVIALKKLLWNWYFSSFTDNFYIWWTLSWTKFRWNMKEDKLKDSFVTCFPRKENFFNIWLIGSGKVSSKHNIFMTLTLTVGNLGNISCLATSGRSAKQQLRAGTK